VTALCLWPHSETCCGKSPIVGARYRRLGMNLITGEMDSEHEIYTVVAVDPIRLDRVFCRRVTIRLESTGREYRPQVSNFWADRYEAIDNVLALHPDCRPAQEPPP